MAMARCDLPVPVPPISTALRCSARKPPLGQIADQRLVDRRAGEVEVVEVLGERQLGDGQLVLDRAGLLLGDLGGEQVADDARRLVLALDAGGHDLVVGGPHAEQLERRPSARGSRCVPSARLGRRLVVAGAIGDRRVSQPQRLRGQDRRRRAGVALAGQDVEDDVGGMDAVGERLGAGGLDRRAGRRSAPPTGS